MCDDCDEDCDPEYDQLCACPCHHTTIEDDVLFDMDDDS